MARDDQPTRPEKQPTPMMAQYLALRADCDGCLLFYRMGDFFELFFEDAATAARVLGIQLTHRGEHEGAPVPMCGVPVHAADGYLAKLIRAGHRVAIAEQVETPAEAKARGGKQPLARRVVRVVTPGTLTEDALLDPAAANRVVALAQAGGEVGIAAADVSTGAFEILACPHIELEAELARLAPREVVAPEALSPHATARWDDGFDPRRGEREMKARWGVATLEGWGDFGRAELAAAGGLLSYLQAMGGDAAALLEPPKRLSHADHLLIDAASRRSLEITRASDGGRSGSLLASVDRTRTAAGARQLAADLDAPSTDHAAIEARLALVALFHDDGPLRERLRRDLAGPDIARALARLHAGRGSPRDLGALRGGLANARALHGRLAALPEQPALLAEILPDLVGQGQLEDRLERALVPEPGSDAAAGGFIAEGFDHALDELRAQSGDARRAIAALEAHHREQAGVPQLKVRHNAVLGYHLEVPQRYADKLLANPDYRHRQTLAGCVRFDAPDLAEAAARVAQAGAHALEIEARHFADLVAEASTAAPALLAAAAALARLDVSAALAERAAEGGWCRPTLADEPCLTIEAGRHPVVEDAVRRSGARFVANDCRLSKDDRLWLVTGPNMGGKSTFLRQNALLAILAQAGSYVPARSATIGIVDRLFSRVGASDDLARGRSTFMVEMVETAAILSQASPRSLVVLDEVGRGTSTFDGLSIAWAVLEAIHDQVRARCLFATHYHELTQLHGQLPCLSVHHVRARDHKGELVFLHEVAPGAADRSYGLAVARLAGLPPTTLARAKAILARLEAERPQGLGDLPLFATGNPLRNGEGDHPAEPDGGGVEAAELIEALDALDPDTLTPREALDALYALKRLANDAQP